MPAVWAFPRRNRGRRGFFLEEKQDAKAAAAEGEKIEAARAVWEMATEDGVSAHEYLKAKQIDAAGLALRVLPFSGPAVPKPYQKIPRRGQLVVPVRDAKRISSSARK